MSQRYSRLAWVACVVVGLGGCAKERETAVLTEARNVVLISIDAFRADRLGCYGSSLAPTPRIDALAREGVLFENAITPATSTLPAHCSILTGTTPPYHGVHADQNYRLEKLNVTLAEVLKKEGFETGAFVGSSALGSQFGLAQGFDTFDETFGLGGRRSARHATDSALAWLRENAAKRMFLFINYQDPAAPYRAPEPYHSKHDGDAYLGELSYVDAQVGRVIDRLEKLGLSDSTMLIVMGAHGEGLGSHSENWHGYFVYHDTTRVPLIVKTPGQTPGMRISEKVGTIDIAGTVASCVGVKDAPNTHGNDLSPYLAGKKTVYTDRFFYSESLLPHDNGRNALFAIEDQSWKYIQSSRPELYDLAGDPDEKNNLYAAQPNLARALQDRLRQELADTMRMSKKGEMVSWGVEDIKFEAGAKDPKDFVRIHEMLVLAEEFLARGDRRGVEGMCVSVLKIRPDVSRAHELLGGVTPYEEIEKRRGHFVAALRHNTQSRVTHFSLGNIYARQRRLQESERHFREAMYLARREHMPDDSLVKALTSFGHFPPLVFESTLHLADTLQALRKLEEATELYYDCLYMDTLVADTPQTKQLKAVAMCRLGEILGWQQRLEDAINVYQDAQTLSLKLECADKGIDIILNGIASRDSALRAKERKEQEEAEEKENE